MSFEIIKQKRESLKGVYIRVKTRCMFQSKKKAKEQFVRKMNIDERM